MGKLNSLELPRHRRVFLCFDRSPTGSQRECAKPLKVTKLNGASMDHRQHTVHGPACFGHVLKLGWQFPSLLIPLYSLLRSQFSKETKTYVKLPFFLTKAQVLFPDTRSQRSQQPALKSSTLANGIAQMPTSIESVASRHQVFAEKPAEGIAACFIPPHPSSHTATALSSQLPPAQLSKQPHLLLLFTYFSGGSTPITASLPDCTVNREEMALIKLGMGTGKGMHIYVLLVLRHSG